MNLWITLVIGRSPVDKVTSGSLLTRPVVGKVGKVDKVVGGGSIDASWANRGSKVSWQGNFHGRFF